MKGLGCIPQLYLKPIQMYVTVFEYRFPNLAKVEKNVRHEWAEQPNKVEIKSEARRREIDDERPGLVVTPLMTFEEKLAPIKFVDPTPTAPVK